MNPGYLSLLLICITIVLLSSGWKEVFLSKASHKEILLFFVFWITGSQITVPLTYFPFLQINGSAVVICGLCLYILIWKTSWMNKIHILLVGLLLASVHFLLLEFYTLDPIFVIFNVELDIAVILSIICLFLKRESNAQIASLSIGLLFGDIYYAYFHQDSLSTLLGSSLFQDKWWLAIIIVRMLTVFMQAIIISYKRFALRYETFRKRGWK